MRIEQRIGRIDRIGQLQIVRATNFVLGDTVEHRVREVLEAKLAAIAEEFGVNKAADVMDSVEAEAMFDAIYLESLLDPGAVTQRADATLEELRTRIAAERDRRNLLGAPSQLDPGAAQRWRRHPIHFWVEKAVTSGLREIGGTSESDNHCWRLTWPDGSTIDHACFDLDGLAEAPDATWLTLDDERVRGIIDKVPAEPPGRLAPSLVMKNLPAGINGTWSIWRIAMSTARGYEQRFMPLFTQGGRAFAPTARRVWDMIVAGEAVAEGGEFVQDLGDLERLAELQAEPIYADLRSKHLEGINLQRQRSDAAFEARGRAIGRIGLENVRRARLKRLENEHRQRQVDLDAAVTVMPSLELITIAEVRAA